MKGLFKKLLRTDISISYMFILLGISTLMMVGYFSYAWFTVRGVQKYSVVTGNLTGTLVIGSNTVKINGAGLIEYVPTTDSDTITIIVTNTNDRTVKNSLYYYDQSNGSISLSYTSDSQTVPSVTGVAVGQGKNLIYKIKINGAKGKTIKIGSSMGLVNSNLSLPSGAKAFEKVSLNLKETLIAGIGSNGKVDTSDYEQTFITGKNPNNYVWYSGKLWRVLSFDSTDNSAKLVTQWPVSSIARGTSGGVNFKGSYVEQWLNDTSVDGFLGNLREPNKFIKMNSIWNATMVTGAAKPSKTTMVTDAVGLVNLYEFNKSYQNATIETGYLNIGLLWWLLSPYSASLVNFVDSGKISTNNPINLYGVRPAINLQSSIKIASGKGTVDNPYRLQGDYDTSLSGTLLSTRYSGEYIRFGTGGNNLYRIVSHENGTGTKITSAIPLKDSGNYKNISFGSNTTFSSNNTIGTFLNGSYLTSGTYLTSEQVNMIDNNATWYLGNVGYGVSHMLSKYQNTTGSTITTSKTTSKVGLLRLGEQMTGQIDSESNNNDYWLLTPASSGAVRVVGKNSYSNSYSPKNTYGIRPTMNLKSNVVITAGDGTKNNPFTIKLG